ncbi:MAG: 30S ribosomal protein S4e [Nanoarchaeota archaeon]
MSKHLKTYFAPKSWKVRRKGMKYIAKPSPGTHKIEHSMPLSVILRDVLKYATTKREARHILNKKNVLVDNIARTDYRFPVGLFDVLSFREIDENFRAVLDKKGRISIVKIGKDESKIKPYKIIGKRKVKGKIQLNLSGGKNILADEDKYKVGDAVLLDLEKNNKIQEAIQLKKDALIYLTGGKHIGQTGKVQEIIGKRILYKAEDGEDVETLKEYAFPVGKDKPLINVSG